MTTGPDFDRRRFLSTVGTVLAFAHLSGPGAAASIFDRALPSLDGAIGWLNSPPIRNADLRGKVVLIDFWTYTCINWRRTAPYLRAWDAKYRKHGLVVIGVHTPEFVFEKDPENVRHAVPEQHVNYPVAIDSEYAIWRAFDNEYWPALYLADAQRHISYSKFGEGDYEQTEREIQRLLKQAGVGDSGSDVVAVDATGAEAAADWNDLRSPENYVGYERTVGFASPGGAVIDKPHEYMLPGQLTLNEWALSGNWISYKGAAALQSAPGRIAYRFHARDLHLVMGSAARGTSVRFRVLLDGQAPGDAHGVDVDAQGHGVASEPRMYQLIRQSKPIHDRTFQIEFLDGGAEAYSFTFG